MVTLRYICTILVVSFTFASAHASPMLDQLCSTLESADYVPGIDVHGNPVVGADLNGGSSITLPSAINIPMTVDVAQYLGVVLPTGADMPASFGNFAVFTDGKVTYQGRDLTENAKAACHNQEIGMEPSEQPAPAPATPEEADSQSTLDTIFSGEFE